MATFTYGGDPSADPKDELRFLVGDTLGTNGAPEGWLLCDEEYTYLLAQYPGDSLAGAAAAADAICAKFARMADEVTGDLQRKCSQKSKAYGRLADKLRKQASDPLTNAPVPFAGGISCDDIDSRQEDTDRYPDTFTIGQDDSRRGTGLKQDADLRRQGFTQN